MRNRVYLGLLIGGAAVIGAGCSQQTADSGGSKKTVIVERNTGASKPHMTLKKSRQHARHKEKLASKSNPTDETSSRKTSQQPTEDTAGTETRSEKVRIARRTDDSPIPSSTERPSPTAEPSTEEKPSPADTSPEPARPSTPPESASPRRPSEETPQISRHSSESPSPSVSSPLRSATPKNVEPTEEPVKPSAPSRRSAEEIVPVPKRHRSRSNSPGRLAIIIDDVGMSTSQITPFLNIDADLTYSIIPETRQAHRCLSLIQDRGHVPMLHLPMEPLKRTELLPSDGITVNLSGDEIEKRVERSLDGLQGVQGVNNHMGSRATQDERVMNSVLNVVHQHHLFFIDSKTVQRTVVGEVAERLGVPYANRTGEFLDDGGNTSRAYQILLDLGREAQRRGSAIGIGHPHAGTAQAIARALPELEQMGVRIVPVSELVHD